MWCRARGERVRKVGQRTHPKEPWARCNPDGQVLTPTRLMEVKAPRSQVYRKLLDHGARERTICQVQWGLHVTGWDGAVYVAGNLESSPMMYSFEQGRYEDLIILMAARIRVFYHEHIVPRVPPDSEEWAVLGEGVRERAGDFPVTGREIQVASDSEALAWARQYAEAREVKKEAEAMMKEVKPDLASFALASVGHERVRLGAYELRVQDRKGREGFDADLLRDHRPIDRDAFVRWCIETGVQMDLTLTDDETGQRVTRRCTPDDMANVMALDVDQFVRRGEPSEAFTLRVVGED
jgi:hypothetical protein